MKNKEYGSIDNIEEEEEVIECNNFNLNGNVHDDSTELAANDGNNANNEDEHNNNNNIFGQLLEPKQGEGETEINTPLSPFSQSYSKGSQSTVICKNFNNNEVPSTDTETLTVIKNTRCEADIETCQQFQIQPSHFNVVIEEGKNPSQNQFPGSSLGTDILLEPGQYRVYEEGLDSVIPTICNTMGYSAGRIALDLGENLFICSNFSDGCEGEITFGNPQTCTIDNVLVQQQLFGNNVYVVWSSEHNGQVNIFFSVSNDNGQTFSNPIDVSNNIPFSFDPYMLVSGNNVYVAWGGESGDDREIFFSVSTDNGQTFSTPIDVSNNDGRSITPIQMLVSGNNVYLVWTDASNGGDFDVFFSVSTDNGQTFSNPIDVSNNDDESVEWQIIVSDSIIYLVWRDTTHGGDFDVFFSVSTDNGQTFSNPIDVSNNSGQSGPRQMLVSGNNIYIVWTDSSNGGDSDVFFSVSTDNGQTFSTPIDVSNDTGSSIGWHLIVSGNNVYVAWTGSQDDYSDRDIFFSVSNDNGQTFSNPIDVSNNSGQSGLVQMVVSGNNIYILSGIINGGDADVFFSVSTDNGQTFSTPIDVSNNDGRSFASKMIVSENNIYIVWVDELDPNSSDGDIFFSVSTDNGQTFSTPTNISNNNGFPFDYQMIVSGINIYLAWIDQRNGPDNDIFFSVSTDNGQTFSTPVDVSNNNVESGGHKMLVSGNNVYLVWTDASNGGDFDVFFSVSTDNGQTFSTPIDVSNDTGFSYFGQMIVQ